MENNYSGDKLTVKIEKVKITTEDNIDLLAWYHKKDNMKYKTILYFDSVSKLTQHKTHNEMLDFLLINP